MASVLHALGWPWRWLKNRHLRPWVLRTIYGLFRRSNPKSPRVRGAIFDSSTQGFLLADGPEPYVVSRKDRIIGRTIYCTGEFEFDKFQKVRKLLADPLQDRVFVDVGANIGTMCIPMLKRGFFTSAIAIEPDPLNLRLLRCNIALNGLYGQISVVEAAAGAQPDTGTLF